MSPAGSYPHQGVEHAVGYQVVASALPYLGRVPPLGTRVTAATTPREELIDLQLRNAGRLHALLHAPDSAPPPPRLPSDVAPTGWNLHYCFERRPRHRRLHIQAEAQPLFARVHRRAVRAAPAPQPIRYTELYDLRLGDPHRARGEDTENIPDAVLATPVATPVRRGWEVRPAADLGTLHRVARVATQQFSAYRALLLHEPVDGIGTEPGTVLTRETNRTVQLRAHGREMLSHPDRPDKITIGLPKNLTIGFWGPSGSTVAVESFDDQPGHPFASVVREGDRLTVRPGSQAAANAAAAGDRLAIMGDAAGARVADLWLSKFASLSTEGLIADEDRPEIRLDPMAHFGSFDAHAQAVVLAGLRHQPMLTVRRSASLQLFEVLHMLTFALDYAGLDVRACRSFGPSVPAAGQEPPIYDSRQHEGAARYPVVQWRL